MQRLSREQRRKQVAQTAGWSWRKILLAALGLILVFAAVDLFWPLNRDLRQFDPMELGRLESAMWRSYYEKALPALESYYAAIHRTGNIEFDVPYAAKVELEWWIVHRERERYGKEALDKACADAAAAIYLVSPDSTLEHGRLRADAMVIRDTQAAAGGVREENWAQIDNLLQGCYRSLERVIQ